MPQTMTVPTLEEIRTAIAMGTLDGELEHITDAVRRRSSFVIRDEVVRGMTVQIRDTAPTAYLRGTHWIVKKVNPTTVSLEYAPGQDPLPSSRYAYGMRAPHSMVKPV